MVYGNTVYRGNPNQHTYPHQDLQTTTMSKLHLDDLPLLGFLTDLEGSSATNSVKVRNKKKTFIYNLSNQVHYSGKLYTDGR